MSSIRIFALTFWVCLSTYGFAQRPMAYIVYFKNKDTTTYGLRNPHTYLTKDAINRKHKTNVHIDMRDIPISDTMWSDFPDAVRVVGKSKWLNAVCVISNSRKAMDTVSHLPQVRRVELFSNVPVGNYVFDFPDIASRINGLNKKVNSDEGNSDSGYYGAARFQIQQLRIDSLHKRGFTGSSVRVAVLDGGFRNAEMLQLMHRYFDHARIGGYMNFVRPDYNVFLEDDHGLSVFSIMATHLPGIYVGSAPGATYYLFCTEDTHAEYPLEEWYWLIGAEFADSIGADLIQSSLGYNEYDESAFSHEIKQLDGKTTLISKAASMAVEKGMFVVTSAGNEGDKDWRFISAPGDVQQVLTVGGVDELGKLAMFSSQGPTADKRIKPDVAAMSEGTYYISATGGVIKGNGTSYAAPLLSGLAACLMQAFPNATPVEMHQAIKWSSDSYFNPDMQVGYGIPDAWLAYNWLYCMQHNRDSILSIHKLNDGSWHIAGHMSKAQTIRWSISNTQNVIIQSGSIRVRRGGIFRNILLSKKVKLARGAYVCKIISEGLVVNLPFSE